MWWSRILPCAVVATLAIGHPAGALGASPADQEGAGEQAADASADPDEPSSAGGSQEEEASGDSESPGEEDADSDADLPGLLIFETDSPSWVFVNGAIEGRLEPDETLEVRVELGEIKIRAISIEARGAIWEKTIELEEPGEESVSIRMQRTIRLWRKEERQSGVFRDPKSRLMWPKKDNGLDVDLRRAHTYCSAMEIGGFGDWRLPLLEELRSLESIWSRGTYKVRGEIVLTECCMWSSEYDGSERAWTFNYRFRQAFQTNAGYAIGLRALCVREWPEGEPGEEGGEPEEGESGFDPGEGDRGNG